MTISCVQSIVKRWFKTWLQQGEKVCSKKAAMNHGAFCTSDSGYVSSCEWDTLGNAGHMPRKNALFLGLIVTSYHVGYSSAVML